MAGLLGMLGRAFQKHPIGAPTAIGAAGAAGFGVLGNENSGWVGRNTPSSDPSEKGAVPPWMRKDSNISEQELKDHIDIWEKHTDLPLESKSFEKFLYSKPNIKNSLIRSAAKLSQDVSQDVDDALYKSDSWQRITKPKDKDSFGFGTPR